TSPHRHGRAGGGHEQRGQQTPCGPDAHQRPGRRGRRCAWTAERWGGHRAVLRTGGTRRHSARRGRSTRPTRGRPGVRGRRGVAEVRTIMHAAGSALIGIGVASGEDRAIRAAQAAISSALLETSMEGARGVLINVTGGLDMGLLEVSEAAQIIKEAADPDANIIFGAVVDDKVDGELRITVIATGFDSGRKPADKLTETPDAIEDGVKALINDLDIPAFLRRR